LEVRTTHARQPSFRVVTAPADSAGFRKLFLVVHVVMVCLAGFRSRMRAMLTDHSPRVRGRMVFIAEWIGVPLSHVLNLTGTLPEARYVVYFSMHGPARDCVERGHAVQW